METITGEVISAVGGSAGLVSGYVSQVTVAVIAVVVGTALILLEEWDE